jgi:hypothetical protein
MDMFLLPGSHGKSNFLEFARNPFFLFCKKIAWHAKKNPQIFAITIITKQRRHQPILALCTIQPLSLCCCCSLLPLQHKKREIEDISSETYLLCLFRVCVLLLLSTFPRKILFHQSSMMEKNNDSTTKNKFYPYAYPQPNMLVQRGSRVLIKGLKKSATASPGTQHHHQLNGLVGTALKFHADRLGHWSVQLFEQPPHQQQQAEQEEAETDVDDDDDDDDDNDGDGHEKKEDKRAAKKETTNTMTMSIVVMIPICHLEVVLPLPEQEEQTIMMMFPIVTRNHPRWASGSRDGSVLLRAGTMMGQPALCLYDDPNRNGFDTSLIYQQAMYMGASTAMVDELLKGGLMCKQQHHHRHHHPSNHCDNSGRRRRSLLLPSYPIIAMMMTTLVLVGFALRTSTTLTEDHSSSAA